VLLNNVGVGLFLASALTLLARDDLDGAAGVGLVAAFAIVALDLLLLVTDLGDPTRFFHMLRVVKLRSPMSLGVWALSALMTILAPVVLLTLAGWVADLPAWLADVKLALVVLALVPGACALLYKGVLFSLTAQPGWRDARWLGAYVGASGLQLGTAALLVVAALGDEEGGIAALRAAALVLVGVAGVTLVLLGLDREQTSGRRLVAIVSRPAAFAAVIGAVVLPLVLLAFGDGAALSLGAGVAVAAGAAATRVAFVDLPDRARNGT
jgi:hypothetical protein